MTIYHCTFYGVTIKRNARIVSAIRDKELVPPAARTVGYSHADVLATHLKGGTKDSFIFIVTNAQKGAWDAFLKEYELQDFLHFAMQKPISNGYAVHRKEPPHLWLMVLKGKAQ